MNEQQRSPTSLSAEQRAMTAKAQIDERIREAINNGDQTALAQAQEELKALKKDPKFKEDMAKWTAEL